MKKKLILLLIILTGMFVMSESMIWAQTAPVAKTGQTISYATGDDGDLQKGVAIPSPRFTDNSDETVTDNLTGLMWAKNANLGGTMTWSEAIDYSNNLILGSAGCGKSYTDWRLPNRFELESLLDLGNANPVLPTGHPFTNLVLSSYWSSTSGAYHEFTDRAWYVEMRYGNVGGILKTSVAYVWPVRSDN